MSALPWASSLPACPAGLDFLDSLISTITGAISLKSISLSLSLLLLQFLWRTLTTIAKAVLHKLSSGHTLGWRGERRVGGEGGGGIEKVRLLDTDPSANRALLLLCLSTGVPCDVI